MKEIIATEEVLNGKGTHVIKIIHLYKDGSTSEKKVFYRKEKKNG